MDLILRNARVAGQEDRPPVDIGIEGLTRAVLVIQAALPSSPYSYVLARELGGDAALMSGIISMQTGLAFLSLPVVIAIVT